eukprot:Nk52_evm48s226 gene=Nk52_evmTU48s226
MSGVGPRKRVTEYIKGYGGRLIPQKKTFRAGIKKQRIFKGDYVEVIHGYEGIDVKKRGLVLSIDCDREEVTVEGVNMQNRKSFNEKGESSYQERESPIHYSRVSLICPVTDLPTRIRAEEDENGNLLRRSVKSGKIIDVPPGTFDKETFPDYEPKVSDTSLDVAKQNTFQLSLAGWENECLSRAGFGEDANVKVLYH